MYEALASDRRKPLFTASVMASPYGTGFFLSKDEQGLSVADVNTISARALARQFDIVACVSGLHHIGEFEWVLGTSVRVLAPDGEFRVIGEAFGRDGDRLEFDPAEVAGRLFQSLPVSDPQNRVIGKIDKPIATGDFPAGTFEGIRSSEIGSMPTAAFEPVQLPHG